MCFVPLLLLLLCNLEEEVGHVCVCVYVCVCVCVYVCVTKRRTTNVLGTLAALVPKL
jgi:hypothetical protein